MTARQPGRKYTSKDPANVARRAKYDNDPDYRKKVMFRAAEYRRLKREEQEAMRPTVYAQRLASLAKGAELLRWGRQRYRREGKDPKPKKPQHCYSVEEMAGVLQREITTTARWIKEGYILPPDLPVWNGRGLALHAYSVARARIVLLALSKVLRSPRGHLRQRHKQTLVRLQKMP